MGRRLFAVVFVVGVLLHPEISSAQASCCHFGGGVCGCQGGVAKCCNGQVSSCPCRGGGAGREEHRLRNAPREGPVLQLLQARFADQSTSPPSHSVAAFKALQKLWLWLDLHSSGDDPDKLAGVTEGELKLRVYWYFDPGSGPVLHSKIDQPVKTAVPLRAVVPTVPTKPGNWIAEVAYGPDRVCMQDDKTCSFHVRVTK